MEILTKIIENAIGILAQCLLTTGRKDDILTTDKA